MQVTAVTAPGGQLLGAVRRAIGGAEDALMCVAFAQARGVHLLAREIEAASARGRARVLVTTTLGSTSDVALDALRDRGAAVRVLNPGSATYHPKVYLGRAADESVAVVGSANLTSGLVANVEAAMVVSGTLRDEPLAQLWDWAESLWADPRASDYVAPRQARDEEIEPVLLTLLQQVARAAPVVYTLGSSPRPNRIADVNAAGLWVETERSDELGTGPQIVEPRMLNLAWDVLRARGRLTNRELLDELPAVSEKLSPLLIA